MKPLYLNKGSASAVSSMILFAYDFPFMTAIVDVEIKLKSTKRIFFSQERKCGKGEQSETAPDVTSVLNR